MQGKLNMCTLACFGSVTPSQIRSAASTPLTIALHRHVRTTAPCMHVTAQMSASFHRHLHAACTAIMQLTHHTAHCQDQAKCACRCDQAKPHLHPYAFFWIRTGLQVIEDDSHASCRVCIAGSICKNQDSQRNDSAIAVCNHAP